MKAYVIFDIDMRFVVSIKKTMGSVMMEILNVMEESGYESFTMNKSINEDEWEITFLGEDERYTGHWVVSAHNLED